MTTSEGPAAGAPDGADAPVAPVTLARPAPAPLRANWALEPGLVFLNHGAFGACPRAALQVQADLRATLEADPVRFLDRDLEGRLDAARARIAAFVGADPTDLVFAPNATAGVNAVLRSFSLQPGDEVIATDHEYRASRNALDDVAARAGATVVTAAVPLPVSGPDEVVERVLAAVTPRTRLLLVSHVTSPTALVFPVERIVAEAEARGVAVLVDGAHGPGMLPLSLASLGVSYYAGNLHKWVCAPKGAAFLFVRRDRQASLRPLAISHGATDGRPGRSRFQKEFDWTGTSDPTAWLTVPAALDAVGSMAAGGWPEVMARNAGLARDARRQLLGALGGRPLASESMLGSMAALELPALELPALEPPALEPRAAGDPRRARARRARRRRSAGAAPARRCRSAGAAPARPVRHPGPGLRLARRAGQGGGPGGRAPARPRPAAAPAHLRPPAQRPRRLRVPGRGAAGLRHGMSVQPAGPIAIELDHLTKRYGTAGWRRSIRRSALSRGLLPAPPGPDVPAAGAVLALADVSVQVRAGEIFGFLGPNGAGKSTAIRLLLGFLRPSSGSARVFGLDVASEGVEIRRRTGYLPGGVELYDGMTGTALLDYLGAFYPRPAARRAELVERLELSTRDLGRRVRDYSRGMRQKLGIVQALQHDPELAILDEPSEGLDPLMQRAFYAILDDLRRSGRTIFLSSHVLSEVERVCDRVAIIRAGRLVAFEDVAGLLARRRRTVEMRLAGPAPDLDGVRGVSSVEARGGLLTCQLEGDVGPFLAAIAGSAITDLTIEAARLEDAFLELYEGADEAPNGPPSEAASEAASEAPNARPGSAP